MRSYSENLAGKQVAILPDNDDPGREHAQIIAASLVGVAAAVKIVQTSDQPKGDVEALTEAILRVSRTFFAYYGTYSVDPIARTVTHHVQGSLRPSWVGTDQLRGFELLDDDRMALTVVLGDAASSDTNFPGSNILMWERLR